MPDPTELPSVAERFWSHVPEPESEDLPEPARSDAVVRNFLTALDHVAHDQVREAPALVALLRRSEVEGDPSYASPEQLRGENLDIRSVIFSLGVVLFERLTGRHPFGAENNRPRRIDRIRRGELGSGVNSFPTIPAGLRSVLVRAMSPFAEERWADLKELRAGLRRSATEPLAVKLPGSSEVVESDEQTRVVRMGTEFGKELMKVVTDHDRGEPGAGSRSARPGRTSAPPVTAAVAATPATAETPAATPATPAARTPMPAVTRPRIPSEPAVRPSPRGMRTGVIAIGGAVVGATVALVAVFALRKSPHPADRVTPAHDSPVALAAEGPAPAPAPVVTAPAPAPAPVVTAPAQEAPAPVVTAPVVKPEPAPAPIVAPAPAGGSIEDRLVAAITPCLIPQKARTFGLSLLFRAGSVLKAYYGADDPLAHTERVCISAAIRGLPGDGGSAEEATYNVHATSTGVTVTLHQPAHPNP